ncbi:DNA-directed RNA polymerase subunit beta [Pacmanvirus S19]|nr:DNA-directed RNA polymerase subunit beta [Pacmanvirus S19]
MATSQMLCSGRISKVRFNLSGTDTVKKDSYALITSYDLFRNNTPYNGGVYDAHLGTTDHSYKCQTCHNTKRNCLGHEGDITLNYPVWNPIAVNEGRKWLKVICFKCGHPIIEDVVFSRFPRGKRLDEAAKIAHSGTGNKKCIHCKEVHPIIKKDKKDANEPLALTAEFYEEKRQTEKWIVYPHKALEVFSRISDETVVKLGKNVSSHPRNFVLTSIKVPPVTIRPDVKKMGGGRSTNDDLTTMLQIIIKKNDIMPSVIPADIDIKLEKSIFELNNSYFEFVKAGGPNAMNSLALRLKGKSGRFRKNQMGKRVRNMCRSTITGDPRIRIGEVGVPLTFARTIQYEETVQEYNKQRLLVYVQNGRKKYPGATKVIKKTSGTEYDVDSAREIDLENGDIVLRDMIDGDPVNFNRQPSLMVSNIATHRAKVITDPNIKTLLMNVIACAIYNADFDGDQMNLIISAGTASRNEIAELASVANWFISHTTSSPALGQVDDSVIGTAELTRSGVKFDKYHAMLLFQNSTYLPSFNDIGTEGITGRDCISKILEETPINFTRTAQWYNPNMSAYIKYDPTEIKVKIDRGKLVSGVLDKKSIGKGANGGVYHIIANEFGAEKALDVMYNMQQMAISYIQQFGYTIGIMDLLIKPESKLEIDSIVADMINKSRLITEKLINGEIIPPIGKTVEEFFEEQQISTLSVFDDFTEPILKAINPNTNNLFKLIQFGSKGKIDNMFNMMSAIGQKLINGERIRQKFGFKRTLPYFKRFDTSPESRGYIENSYLGGMTTVEYVPNAAASRFDLISKALSTSVTGEQNRKSIKNLESIIINNYRWATKNQNIIELAYGEDFLDPRKVERVQFSTVMCSDEEFDKKYHHKSFDKEFELMKADREKYRKIFMQVEHMNVKELMSDERRVPVNVSRVIFDALRAHEDAVKTPDDKTLSEMVATVNALCEGIPYVLINEIQEKLKTPVPEYIAEAAWLLIMLVRSHLHPNALVEQKMTPNILKIVIDKIRLRYAQALIEPGTAAGIIAAQSFSEPLTQYMLDAHHRSASGGTSKGSMTRAKEVLGAKSVEKLVNPTMLIPILPEFAESKAKVQEIANNIEVMKFHQFVVMWQVFFEKYGEPTHSKYKDERKMIAEFTKLNPLLIPPGDLIKWCIRFTLNKTTLILKNMSLDLIITKLRELYPDTFIVYSPENASNIVIRIYMRNTMFKGQVSLDDIIKQKETILNTIIRGVDGIINTTVVKMIRNKINPDGSVSRNDNLWGISTVGTNIRGILANKFVDKYKVQTDAIQEMSRLFGIEAARQKVVSELRNLVDSCNHRHYLTYANEMTYTGKVTSIESSGLKTREASNILLRVGFSSPLATLEEAAVNSSEDAVTGITAPLLVGSVPRVGTLYQTYIVDESFVKANVKKPDDVLEQLFD